MLIQWTGIFSKPTPLEIAAEEVAAYLYSKTFRMALDDEIVAGWWHAVGVGPEDRA